VKDRQKPAYLIAPWRKDHDASQFTSDIASIRKYILEQAQRDTASRSSAIFVLTEAGQNIVRAYYSLSSISIIFSELPNHLQKKLPRYRETSGILLGRLGVDKLFSEAQTKKFGTKPRLGEMLLIDAQQRALASTNEIGSALMIIDAELLSSEEIAQGAKDPLSFYTQYGFIALTSNPRRLVKTMRSIAKEFESA
jgi:hypothetical protein